jgi:hypothetical protein
MLDSISPRLGADAMRAPASTGLRDEPALLDANVSAVLHSGAERKAAHVPPGTGVIGRV